MRGDFHMHSVYSDGTKEIKELLDRCKSKNLDYIAVTDHDSVLGVPEAIKYGKEIGIKVIPGMELSTYRNGAPIHVLGYFPQGVPEKIVEFSKMMTKTRKERALKMAQNMIDIYGLKMDLERLSKLKGMITRSHLGTELCTSNPGITRKEAFEKYLGDNSKGYIPSTKMSYEDGIKFLRENNAFIVIAHPVLIHDNDILDIIKAKPDGLEAIYPKNKPEDEVFFRRLAHDNKMIITAGSDYHGIIDYKHEDVAYNVLTGNDLDIFLERLKEHENKYR